MKKSILISTAFLLVFYTQSVFTQSAPRNTPICNGLATYLPKPEIPQSVINANGKNIFGVVNVQILIDEKGNVEKAQAVSGHLLVKPLAEKAALKAKFTVTTHTGKPIKINCVLVYNFASYDPKKSVEETQKEIDLAINLGVLNEKALILPMPEVQKDLKKLDIVGSIIIQVKINLQTGEVVSAKFISGLSKFSQIRESAERAALTAKFPPVLTGFSDLFGQGFLIYKFEDFNGKTVENKTPKKFLIIEKGVVNNRAKSLPKPKFPSGGTNALGFVKVIILIDMNGEVVLAKSESGHPLLKPFAESAARETKFNRTLITDSELIYVKASLLYKFNSDHTVETNLTDEDLN